MHPSRFLASAAIVVAAFLASAVAVGAQPSAAARADARVRAAQQTTTGAEFVVGYEGSVADATAAVVAAGGTVLDVNEALGVALVSAPDETFLTAVRAEAGVTGAARNHSVGTVRPGMPHRFAEERPSAADRAAVGRAPATAAALEPELAQIVVKKEEPLAALQWDMAMIAANANGAHRRANGGGVTVGIIDTGIDASHPDLKGNFNRKLSRNFTIDIPTIDGPCEFEGCVDPADVDHGGHGTHVAGTVAARRNNFGIAGVAPRAKLVNLRAGQDSGFFFAFETVSALTYAGDAGLDVVNMSFFTDPWLFNCSSADDYIAGPVTADQLAEQAFTRQIVMDALEYAHGHGVTLVGSAGNEHVDLALPTRTDGLSPNFPAGTEQPRTVTNDCLILPGEGPHVIQVSSVGPSTAKADYSNYGNGNIEIAAPGGWFRDYFGTPQFQTPGNMILSTYPMAVAIAEGLADADGNPVDAFSMKVCNKRGKKCGFYTYLQGTSMAAPHVAGVAALIVQEHGLPGKGGFSLDPDMVGQILASTATDHDCPPGGVEDYSEEGRPAEFNAVCDGTAANNGLYGEGIVNALAAVQ